MSHCTYSGAVKADNRNLYNPDRPDRSFRSGQVVRFMPPEGAYHHTTTQAAMTAQIGQVAHVFNSDYCHFFERQQKPLLVNANYLILEESL